MCFFVFVVVVRGGSNEEKIVEDNLCIAPNSSHLLFVGEGRTGASPRWRTKTKSTSFGVFFCFRSCSQRGSNEEKIVENNLCIAPNSSHLLFVGEGRTGASPRWRTKKTTINFVVFFFFAFASELLLARFLTSSLPHDFFVLNFF